MNLPISWLKKFVNISASSDEIAEKLTLSGSEVEKISRADLGLSRVVVGLIKEVKQHPDADKLSVAFVDIGKTKDLQIVCGAKNIKPGQKVPCVLVGGSVPGLKVEEREIRGVRSCGMLASSRELGIGEDHSGIFILPKESKVGENAISILELDDPVLEIEVTPNRPDCFSVFGLSREVSALFGLKLKSNLYLKNSVLKKSFKPNKESINLEINVKEKTLCPKYLALILKNISVAPSPLWMQNKLRQSGIRPINNIVDVTNYIMMEFGHPLHAFDYDKIFPFSGLDSKDKKSIIIRRAKKGETILALDENTYELSSDNLVIADEKHALAIAGIMGGSESAVFEETKNIILEAAVFDPVSIRKSSRELGLRSESSLRFEKGVDFESAQLAISSAASLIKDLSGGEYASKIISSISKNRKEKIIKFEFSEIKRILGIDLSVLKVKSILESLGFEFIKENKNLKQTVFEVKVPSWRESDVSLQIDLIEEIGRMVDYNKMPKTLPTSEVASPLPNPMFALCKNIRNLLRAEGYSEILTYSFYGKKGVELSGLEDQDHYVLTNPVNDEFPYLRTSLSYWMLEKLSQNSSLLSIPNFKLFEIGRVFNKKKGEETELCLGLIEEGSSKEALYRRLRGVIEMLFDQEDFYEEKSGDSCYVFKNKEKHTIASISILTKSDLEKKLRFKSLVSFAKINLDALVKTFSSKKTFYKHIPFYPVVEMDLGVVVNSVVKYKEIFESITKFDKLIKHVELFDVYHGISGSSTSLAFRITFGSTDRTLTSKEVDEILENLKTFLVKKYKVSFR